MLAPLIRTMYAYYSDPAWAEEDDEESAFRVGIGSLCGRAHPAFLLSVIERVQQQIGDDVPLHLWGVKLKTLQAGVSLPGVISVDTGAWNGLWGQEHERRKASGLSPVDYSWQVSHPRYAHRVEAALSPPQQIPLAFSSPALPWHRIMLIQRKIADAIANEEDGSESLILQDVLAYAACRE